MTQNLNFELFFTANDEKIQGKTFSFLELDRSPDYEHNKFAILLELFPESSYLFPENFQRKLQINEFSVSVSTQLIRNNFN